MNTDSFYLLKALSLATLGRGHCAPNPAVGAVIVNQDNQIIATGYHKGCGQAHAEVDALQKITEAAGATLYVTLEPCCHWGKTPPCTDAIIKAKVKRVVYSYRDPNPIVSGKGIAALTQAGIECEWIPLSEITAFYQSYQHWLTTQTPFVTAKMALSLDGKLAGKNGQRVQITGEATQELTHYHRKLTDAILTTAKTIAQDDPQLNARYQNEIIAKQLFILDRTLSLPTTATILKTAKKITVFHAEQADVSKKSTLEKLQVECIAIAENQHGLDLKQVIKCIGNAGIHDLWVEAGGKCFASLMNDQLVQRALVYVAPHIIGEGRVAFDQPFLLNNETSRSIQWQQLGHDVVLDVLL